MMRAICWVGLIVRMCLLRRFLAYHAKGEEETIMRILRVVILIVGVALCSAPSHSQAAHLKRNGLMQCVKAGT